MIDLDKDIELYKSKVAFYESQNTRGEYAVTVRELKFVVEILEALRAERIQGDCISREALKKAIEPYRYAICGFEGILALIDNAPTVEPERPKGEWVVYGRQGDIPITDKCTNCNYEMKWYKTKYNFCPNCGADMKGNEK